MPIERAVVEAIAKATMIPTIAPMALLVPVFGMAAAALLLGEPLPGWKLLAAGLVIGGLALNLFAPHWRRPKTPPAA